VKHILAIQTKLSDIWSSIFVVKKKRKQLFVKVKAPKEGTIIKFKKNYGEINSF